MTAHATMSPHIRIKPEDPASIFRRFDIGLFLVTLMITAFGLVIVYSATRGTGDQADRGFLDRQLTFAFIGVALMFVVTFMDYRHWRNLVLPAYLAMLAVLGAVAVLGVEVNGARAWFRFGPFQLQPSEFGKIVVILALAAFLSMDRVEMSFRRLATALMIAAVPSAAIMLQPDLGTVLVYVAIAAAVVVVGGAKSRHLLVLSLLVVGATVGALQVGVLDGYQVDRLTAFVDKNPSADNAEVFEQQKYAQTAIGSGGLLGEGLFEGTQNRSKLIRHNQSDFIFTVVGEELGFAGSAVLIALYGLMILRIWRIGSTAPDLFGMLICTGVMAMFMFQVFESMGMSTGIMPITGIPMPFFSYGGSSILASFLGLGLVQSVHMQRFV